MHRVLAALLIVVSAFMLFYRLGATPIWRDEGTTAVWARAMAENNWLLPWVYDDAEGQLMVQADDGHDVNSKMLPAMQAYLQFYVAALSFKVLGADAWSARFPFALLGALTLFVLWLIGKRLFGPGILALVPPGTASVSMLFLHAARQCRYYMLAGLFATLVVYELCRYLEDRNVVRSPWFFARLATWGLLLNFSNYVAFLGTWTAVGLWVLWTRDFRFTRRFILTCFAMAVPVLADFFALHAEFASSWPPPSEAPFLELMQGPLTNRARDFWRAIPVVAILPAAAWLAWSRLRGRTFALAATGTGVAAALSGLWWSQGDWAELPLGLFWVAAALCLLGPLGLFLSIDDPGKETRAAVLCGLILIVGPLVALGAVKAKTSTRHYYQILPAAILVSSLAVAGVARKNRPAGVVLFAGMALWPALDLGWGGTEQIVRRQFVADRSYVGPLLDFMEREVPPGSKMAFVRNVKGMTTYFYRPDIRWNALLNADAPHNAQFRGRIPDDQFDDCDGCADWYVVWDPRGTTPKGLDREAFELVWTHEYPTWLGWWDREKSPSVRKYQVWKRKEADGG